MDMKKKIEVQCAEAESLMKQLKEAGKTDEEIHTIIMNKGYLAPTLSKLFHASGHKLAPTPLSEDQDLAKNTIAEKKDARKPIREKEIEDAAWFHNLLHDLGKHTYHKLVQYVNWTEEDMANPEHATKTLTSYIDTLQRLIEDSGQIPKLKEALELSEIKLHEVQLLLNVAVSRVETLSWYNEILIKVMPPNVRLEALNQMMIAGALKLAPKGLAQAQMEANPVD